MTVSDTPIQALHPGVYVQRELTARGWSQSDLAAVLERPRPAVNEIIRGKRGITLRTAVQLESAFGTPAAQWLEWDTAYRLSRRKGG